jgi:hypothetical protein
MLQQNYLSGSEDQAADDIASNRAREIQRQLRGLGERLERGGLESLVGAKHRHAVGNLAGDGRRITGKIRRSNSAV